MKRIAVLTIPICSILALTSMLTACTPEPAETVTVTKTVTPPATTVTETVTPPALTVITTLPAETVTTTVTLPAITITETITPAPPTLNWIPPLGPGAVTVQYWYAAGVLVGCTVYKYFEVTDGSGEVEITVAIGDTSDVPFIENSEITNTFFVEEGQSYRLSIEVSIISRSPEPMELEGSFNIFISSPYAASSEEVTIGGGYFHRVGLGGMNLEPW